MLEMRGEVGNFGDSLRCNAFELRLFGDDLGILGIRCPVGDLGISGVANKEVFGTSLAVMESRSMRLARKMRCSGSPLDENLLCWCVRQ